MGVFARISSSANKNNEWTICYSVNGSGGHTSLVKASSQSEAKRIFESRQNSSNVRW